MTPQEKENKVNQAAIDYAKKNWQRQINEEMSIQQVNKDAFFAGYLWSEKVKQKALDPVDYPLLLDNIRCALAEYMRSEGCSCCRDIEGHDWAANELGNLLDIPKYPDNSGFDYSQYYIKR